MLNNSCGVEARPGLKQDNGLKPLSGLTGLEAATGICGVPDVKSNRKRFRRGCDPDRLAHNIAASKAKQDAEFLAWAETAPLAYGMCYFASANEYGAPIEQAIIKIGFSRSVSRRIGQLRSQAGGLKVTLLATARGGVERERYYHQKFAANAQGGEWFSPHPALLAEIARLSAAQVSA